MGRRHLDRDGGAVAGLLVGRTDRRPVRFDANARPIIAAAGLFTVVVPRLTSVVLPLVADPGARTGSLVASAVVFFVPALLLATNSRVDREQLLGRIANRVNSTVTVDGFEGFGADLWESPIVT